MIPDSFVYLGNYAINGLIEGLLISLPALALTLVMGIARFVNVGTGDYMTLSAYATVGVQQMFATTATFAALGALLAGGLVSLFFYATVFRLLRGRSFVMCMIASIGVAFLIRSMLTLFAGHDQHIVQVPLVRAWSFGGLRLLPTDLVVAGVAVAALLALFGLLHLTSIGKQMRAVADNPDLARASGIRSRQIMIVLWLVVGLLCGLGGVLFGIKAVVMPELGWLILIPAITAMILGGAGSPVGAVVGALILGVVQELSVPFIGSSYKLVVPVVILLIVLLVRPRGLFGSYIGVR